jgi:hypothetical protein
VKLGDTVATVGFPNIGLKGFAPKLAKGEIGALPGAQDGPRFFPNQRGRSAGQFVRAVWWTSGAMWWSESSPLSAVGVFEFKEPVRHPIHPGNGLFD